MLARTRRLRAMLLFAAIATAAALVDLGSMHRLEQGDSFVPVLVALQRWTPFYWDQERYGMLVPLLALPVRDPLWNLLLQRFLLVLAGLLAIPLFARHVLPDRDWPLAGALATALLFTAPEAWRFEYLGNQPYGLALALALAGLAFAEPLHREVAVRAGAGPGDGAAADASVARTSLADALRDALRTDLEHPLRLAAGLALVLLAHWVNAATGILLVALALARAAVDALEGEPGDALRARLLVDVGLLAAGLAAGQVFLRLWPALSGNPLRLHVAPLSPGDWPQAWSALLANAWREAGVWRGILGACAACGVALLATAPRLRPALPGAILRALALCLAALVYALFAGSLRWVEENAFHWRYLAPGAVLVQLAAAALLAEPLARLRGLARPLAAAAVVLVPAAALAASGPPSLVRVRADLDRVAGRYTADVLAARCDLVAGDYWSVWPAVWHAALALRERGEARRVWGISHRSNPTLSQWEQFRGPGLRICVPHGENVEAERWLRSYHLWPVREVERRATVSVRTPGG